MRFPSPLAGLLPVIALGLPLEEASAQGNVVQTLEAFFTPAAAARTEDGRTLYITNAARNEAGMVAGRGAVSKVRVGDDGQLSVESARFAKDLNAPLGITVLPVPIGPLPEGALAVTVGGSWTVDNKGDPLDPAAAGTGLVFLDAATGLQLGRIFIGLDSAVEAALGHRVLDPVAVAADARGNLYVADIAGARRTAQRTEGQPGLIKLTPDATAALLGGQPLPAGGVAFAPVEELPTGIAYSLAEDALYFTTGTGFGELGGAIFRLPRGDFSGRVSFDTVVKGMDSLAGVAWTPNGTIVASRNAGDIVYVYKRARARPIKFKNRQLFLSPGQMVSFLAPDGTVRLVVPEMSGSGQSPWRQRVHVVALPQDF